MSLPPNPDARDEVDDRYRRASALDTSRPGEAVRQRVLEHAARLAAERTSTSPSASAKVAPAPQRPPRWWRPAAVFGTLAAAALAALMIAPRFLVSPVTPALRPLSAPPVETRLQQDKAGERSPSSPTPAPEPAPFLQEQPAATPSAPVAGLSSVAPARAATRPRVPQPAAARDATSKQERTEAYGGEAAAAASRPAAGASVTTENAIAGINSQQVTVTAARRAALAPPAANVTDAAAALRHAAETGDLGTLDRLVAKPSDINARDAAGRTPLMLAVLNGQTETVSALLAYGADPNAADSHGTTPLQAARAAGRPAIIAALQRYGAR